MTEKGSARVPMVDFVPPELRESVRAATASALCWADDGPHVGWHTRSYDPPLPLWQAWGYLERYRGLCRTGTVRLGDGRVLWLGPDRFLRLDPDDRELPAGRAAAPSEAPDPQMLEPPLDRSYWVADDLLIGGIYPGDRDPAVARAKCERLLYFGVRHVISLMEEREVGHDGTSFVSYREMLQTCARERGVEVSWERHPIRDCSVTSQARMRSILDSIDRANGAGRIVYVHCWGGRGRTGTVVGCWLARHGVAEGQAALDRIAALRSRRPDADAASPETEEQREMVRGWRVGE